MFRKMVGPAFLTAGLAATCGAERLWFSSKCCRRCGAPKPNGSPGAPEAAAQEEQKARDRPMSKPSTPPEFNLEKLLHGLKDNEHFKGWKELAAMQAKAEKALEADKLAKTQCSHTRHSGSLQAKEQVKLAELEAAKKVDGSVEEAKQKSDQTPGGHRPSASRLRSGAGTPGSNLGFCHTSSKVRARCVPGPFWLCLSPASPHRPFEYAGGLQRQRRLQWVCATTISTLQPDKVSTDALNGRWKGEPRTPPDPDGHPSPACLPRSSPRTRSFSPL